MMFSFKAEAVDVLEWEGLTVFPSTEGCAADQICEPC